MSSLDQIRISIFKLAERYSQNLTSKVIIITYKNVISAKIAAVHIKRRIETKEPKVILLSLELLDLAM
jgi:hypothetical protein